MPLRSITSRWDMPLLGRELIEQAMRPRTYALRLAWAALLFALFTFTLYARFQGGRTALGESDADPSLAIIGQGRELFRWVLIMQLVGIVVFLPALMADAITRERERNALDLLLITQLGPWDIVAQKLISRLVPMATIIMVCLPLLGVAYTYGGVSSDSVWLAVWALTVTCMQVGAICLALSTDAPRTSSAMLSGYIRLPIVLLALFVLGCVVGSMWREILRWPLGLTDDLWAFSAVLPAGLLLSDPPPPALAGVLFSLPSIAVVIWFLRRSRNLLVDVVMANPAERPTPSFELADVPKMRGQRLHGELPDQRPVVWMDRTSHLHVQLRKVFVVAIGVDLPVFLFLATGLVGGEHGQYPGLAFMVALVWLIAVPVVAIIAASAFAAERTGQTLEVLLTTPIPTADLVRQKAVASARFALMMVVPLAAAVGVEWLLERSTQQARQPSSGIDPTLYLVTAAMCIAVYLPLATWLGIWVGIRVRDRARAILVVLLIVLGVVVVVPMLIDSAAAALAPQAGSVLSTTLAALRLLSPASILWTAETNTWPARLPGDPWLWVTANFACWIGVLLYLRHLCLHRCDPHLGRIPDR